MQRLEQEITQLNCTVALYCFSMATTFHWPGFLFYGAFDLIPIDSGIFFSHPHLSSYLLAVCMGNSASQSCKGMHCHKGRLIQVQNSPSSYGWNISLFLSRLLFMGGAEILILHVHMLEQPIHIIMFKLYFSTPCGPICKQWSCTSHKLVTCRLISLKLTVVKKMLTFFCVQSI